jgi:hypothetical protein
VEMALNNMPKVLYTDILTSASFCETTFILIDSRTGFGEIRNTTFSLAGDFYLCYPAVSRLPAGEYDFKSDI